MEQDILEADNHSVKNLHNYVYFCNTNAGAYKFNKNLGAP
jgi:hypothetical protein